MATSELNYVSSVLGINQVVTDANLVVGQKIAQKIFVQSNRELATDERALLVKMLTAAGLNFEIGVEKDTDQNNDNLKILLGHKDSDLDDDALKIPDMQEFFSIDIAQVNALKRSTWDNLKLFKKRLESRG